ncbi:MAG: RNA polymerase factor sigma-54 [Holosporales bacterium]|jgi:RNA polymerase sigma-54 factor|nr:RNA polymerase factor sigma-54 [Holosporales bacterium]
MKKRALHLDMRATQALVITSRLQLAIKMLQMNNLDLTAFLQQKAESNPFLQVEAPEPLSEQPLDGQERTAREKYTSYKHKEFEGPIDTSNADFDPLARVASPVSLRDHLTDQLFMAFPHPKERIIGALIIDALDYRGYIPGDTIQSVAQLTQEAPEAVEAVLRKMQQFTPVGIFASSLKESFKIQLADTQALTPVMEILIDNLELFEQGRFESLQKLCNVSIAEIRRCIHCLRVLTPYPGASFNAGPLVPRIPDVIAKNLGEGDWVLELNPETLPKILVNETYHTHVSTRTRSKEDKKFVQQNFIQAIWLKRVLDQRASTILRIAREIVCQQSDFFERGIHYLRPLTLRQVAEELNVHESTVSRVTSTKSIQTPFGVLDFKFFFSSMIHDGKDGTGRASTSVRCRVKDLIERESPTRPFSDDQLAEILFREDKIAIARRTIAKYRNGLNIPTAAQRRRLHKMTIHYTA